MGTSPRIAYQQGDHVCTLYTTPEEQLVAAVEYIRGGLGRGERCLYICCEHSPKDFREALKRAGIKVEAEEARGALVLITKHEGHLKGGSFSCDKMISVLHAAVKDALDAGFAGLCAAGDMSWLLDGSPGSENFAEYEARLNQFYKSNRALGLCLYNRATLPPAMLDHCIATHPYIRMEGPILLENPFYEPPERATGRTARPAGVRQRIQQIESSMPRKFRERTA